MVIYIKSKIFIFIFYFFDLLFFSFAHFFVLFTFLYFRGCLEVGMGRDCLRFAERSEESPQPFEITENVFRNIFKIEFYILSDTSI